MKVVFVSNEEKVRNNTQDASLFEKYDCKVVTYGASEEEIIEAAKEAEVLVADAVQPVTANMIEHMPKLKLIHSEGVAFNSFDVKAARAHGVDVCNCKGMNAHSVAEQTILLMLGLIKDAIRGDSDAKNGRQMETKLSYMKQGNLRELGECTVGLVGFGDIAKATAKLLAPFGCRVLYNASHRHDPKEEQEYGVTYCSLQDLLAQSDIVSLHLPVNENTLAMANDTCFDLMKDGSLFVNTSRGELVDNEALIRAMKKGKVSKAGLDVMSPEPVTKDNALLMAGPEITDRLVTSCHIGGITAKAFKRGYEMIWKAIAAVEEGREPANIVNR